MATIHDMITKEISEKLRSMSPRVADAIPTREPRPKNGKWKYALTVPYIAPGAKENVIHFLDAGLISSATRPIQDMEAALRKYYQVPMAKACNTGYSALVIGLKLSNIGIGDEVLIPSLTMIAVANAVREVGANPVFVDCAPGKLNPNLDDYKDKLTPECRGLIVAYTYGTTVDSFALASFCKSHNLSFIEDISEATGTTCKGKLVGTFGDYACSSLYANKIITAGDGGFVISRHSDPTIFDRATSYTNHAFVKSYHFVHFECSGNFKMSGLAAALVTPAIPLIPEVMRHRTRLAEKFRELLFNLQGIKLMEKSEFGPDAPWVFGIECKSRELKDHVRLTLTQEYGIETRDYFYPIHLQPAYQIAGQDPSHLPHSERLGRCGFYLPTHYYLTDKDMEYIGSAVRDSVASVEIKKAEL